MTFKTSRQTVRKLMLGQRRYFDLIMISQNWRRADIGPMLGKMAFITSRQTVRKLMLGRCFLDLNYDIGKLTSGRHLTDVWIDEIHDKSANDQKIDDGPTLLFRPNYDIAKLTAGRHLANVGKDDIQNKSANCQKIDVGPTLFRPDYDIAKLTSGRHLANVGKDYIHDKSANCQKINVGPTLLFRPDYDIAKLTSGRHLANVVISTWLWYRKTDVGPTSGQCWERWHSYQVD